ncbi:MAG: Xaa-Pro peptidase family protein, partial [Myxococcota bacterium]
GGDGSAPDSATASSVESPPDPFASLAGFCDGIVPPGADEYAEHVARIQRHLTAEGYDGLVTEPSATMTWLSGVRWGRSERPFLMLTPAKGEPTFVCPAFEEGTARERLGGAKLRVWNEDEDPFAPLAAALPRRSGKVAVDGETRAFIVQGLRGACKQAIVDGRDVVDAGRMVKTELELSRLRRANEATKAALSLVAGVLKEGMPQSEVASLVIAAQERAGLTGVWPLVLVGKNAAFPHGTQEDRVVTAGDLLLVDTGGTLHGYRSDITRTWAVGTPAADAAKAWRTVAAAQRAGLDVMRPGVTCGEVDAAARAVIEDAGYGKGYTALTHRLGHGIGLQVHEPPYLRPRNDRVLAAGMTMSNEPGIYRRGEYGVRIEDIVAITGDGVEVFGPTVKSLEQPFG